MFRDRTFQSFLLAGYMIICAGFLRQSVLGENFYSGKTPSWFWNDKVHAPAQYDIVILGDSRVYRGVSPESMQKVLSDHKILNFGFSAGGLNPEIYEVAEQKLNPNGKGILVLGVSPLSLTPKTSPNTHYHTILESDGTRLPISSRFFHPITIRELQNEFFPDTIDDIHYQEPRPNGWVASYRQPKQLEHGIELYQEIFDEEPVSAELINEMIDQVKVWHENDYCVYAMRPPALNEIVRIENEMGGFDEAAIQAQLQTSGAIWISTDQTDLETYDGSHLHMDSARRFSQDIAQFIANNPCQ